MFLSFKLRKKRINTQGASIIAFLSMRGTSHKIGLGLKCPVKTWDKELRRAKGKNKEAQAINAHLDLIRSRFNTLHLKCEHDKIALTCEQVKNYILYEKSIEPEAPVLPTFLEVWKEYIAYRKELQVIRGLPDSKERVWGVKCKMIERACNTLPLYISVAQISLKHAYQLYDFFVLQEKKVERSVARLIRDCRTVFAFAQRREYIKSNPFADFSVQLPSEPAPLFLTEEDLSLIIPFRFI